MSDSRGWLRDAGHTALVDFSLCESGAALEGRLVQAIGEVVTPPAVRFRAESPGRQRTSVPAPCGAPLRHGRDSAQEPTGDRAQPPVVALRARVVRDVEGMDVALYRRAIVVRRKALAGMREAGATGLPTFHVP